MTSRAQDVVHVVTGIVTDAESGEALFGATVVDVRTRQGTATDRYGRFSLVVRDDTVTLRSAYLGYITEQRTLVLPVDTLIRFIVRPEQVALPEITVLAEPSNLPATGASRVQLLPTELERIPAMAGESDVVKAIQLMPGVHGGREGSAGLHVRGGGADQNLILLDGMPVYNVNHLLGFLSAFNPDIVRAVELTKGPGSARHGGRLSSVLDVAMREGDRHEMNTHVAVGLISSRISVDGPISRGRSSFLLSARRTYMDALWSLIQPPDEKAGYYFYDLVGKVSVIGRSHGLYGSLYGGRDRFWTRTREEDAGGIERYDGQLYWGNLTGSIRWHGQLAERVLASAGLGRTSYNITFEEDTRERFGDREEVRGIMYWSGVQDWYAHADLDLSLSPAHRARVGASFVLHRFDPSVTNRAADDQPDSVSVHASEFALYAEDAIELSERWHATVGMRASAYKTKSGTNWGGEPRLALRHAVTGRTAIEASFGVSRQYVHLLSRTGVGIPLDLWLPATDLVPPERAWHITVGGVRSLTMLPVEASLEVYFKEMRGLVHPLGGGFFMGVDATNWEDRIISRGRGRAYGMELLLRKREGRLTGWIAYTLANSIRRFEEIDSGSPFPDRFDRRHDVAVTGSYQLNENWEVNGTFVYATGNAIWVPASRIPAIDAGIGYPTREAPQTTLSAYIYGARNRAREPSYHRLDLSFRHFKATRWGRRTWTLGVYNLYGHRNPFFIYASTDEQGGLQYRRVSPFVLIPSISVEFER